MLMCEGPVLERGPRTASAPAIAPPRETAAAGRTGRNRTHPAPKRSPGADLDHLLRGRNSRHGLTDPVQRGIACVLLGPAASTPSGPAMRTDQNTRPVLPTGRLFPVRSVRVCRRACPTRKHAPRLKRFHAGGNRSGHVRREHRHAHGSSIVTHTADESRRVGSALAVRSQQRCGEGRSSVVSLPLRAARTCDP